MTTIHILNFRATALHKCVLTTPDETSVFEPAGVAFAAQVASYSGLTSTFPHESGTTLRIQYFVKDRLMYYREYLDLPLPDLEGHIIVHIKDDSTVAFTRTATEIDLTETHPDDTPLSPTLVSEPTIQFDSASVSRFLARVDLR